uniref:hypothetical protein n=1 Tax=Brevundimonas sp. FT23028 TaxID=3393748 RepID=UPI003B586C19
MDATPDIPSKPDHRTAEAEPRLVYDRGDPDVTLDSFEDAMEAALRADDIEKFSRLGRAGMIALRFWQARQRHRGRPAVSAAVAPPARDPAADPDPEP